MTCQCYLHIDLVSSDDFVDFERKIVCSRVRSRHNEVLEMAVHRLKGTLSSTEGLQYYIHDSSSYGYH